MFVWVGNCKSGGIYALKENTLYTFRRCDDATTHPFDVYAEGGSGAATGITGSTTLSLTTGKAGDRYTWVCTTHSQMTGTFQAASRKCLAKDASTFSWDVTPDSDAVCIRRTPFDWVQLGDDIVGSSGSELGNSVSLSADGLRLAVGARYHGGATSPCCCARVGNSVRAVKRANGMDANGSCNDRLIGER